MSYQTVHTYQDCIDHAIDYGGAASDPQTERYARRAVQDAMNSIWDSRNWAYFYSRGRINTVAPYSTGTVAYDATGGSSERLVTLADGTLPTWAGDGTLLINTVPYDIFTRLSDTTAQMATYSNPGIDIASSSYTLFRDTYTLPLGFGAMGQLVNMTQQIMMVRTTPDEMVISQRLRSSPGQPVMYSIQADPRRMGVLSVKFYPPPDAVYAMDFSYRRSPRDLNVVNYTDGTVSTVADSVTVTGSGTVWTSSMVGAVIRFSADATTTPTGLSGASPAVMSRRVVAVPSATSLTMDSVASSTLTGVKHSISDPIDIEEGAMLNFLLRTIEKSFRLIRRLRSTPEENALWREAQMDAFEADARSYEHRATFNEGMIVRRMRDMPSGPDVL